MNCFDDDKNSKINMKKTTKLKPKAVKEPNKLKRKSSCLKDIIDESRKKR